MGGAVHRNKKPLGQLVSPTGLVSRSNKKTRGEGRKKREKKTSAGVRELGVLGEKAGQKKKKIRNGSKA